MSRDSCYRSFDHRVVWSWLNYTLKLQYFEHLDKTRSAQHLYCNSPDQVVKSRVCEVGWGGDTHHSQILVFGDAEITFYVCRITHQMIPHQLMAVFGMAVHTHFQMDVQPRF